jgi:two-component system, NarL family, invasion response regulator UvrY
MNAMTYNDAPSYAARAGNPSHAGEMHAAPTPVRVLVVDDHAVVRAGFAQLVSTAGDLKVAGEAGTASDAVAFVRDHECDVVLLDVSLPDATVLDTIASMQSARPGVRILVVSMHPEEHYAVNLLRAGISGYFSKAQAGAELLKAIRLVATGHKYLSDSLAASLALAAAGDAPLAAHARLSKREFQVFQRLALGNSVTEIADEMGLSIKTVSTYRTRIMEKMNMTRNADITAYAMRHGFLDERTETSQRDFSVSDSTGNTAVT